jgi:hypothetical protein
MEKKPVNKLSKLSKYATKDLKVNFIEDDVIYPLPTFITRATSDEHFDAKPFGALVSVEK